MASKIPMKSRRWNGRSLSRDFAPRLGRIREDHFLNRVLALDAFLGMLEILEEHVLGAAKADALGAHFSRYAGIARRIGIGAHAEFSGFIGPFQQGFRRPWAVQGVSNRPGPNRRSRRCHRA